MGEIKRRPAAKQDLIDLYRRIAKDAPMRAGPFLHKIYETLVTLSNRPLIGAARLPSFPEVRVFPLGNYVIIYRPLAGNRGIELVRVLHSARDWQNLIGEDLD